MNPIPWRSKQTKFEVGAYLTGMALFLVISICILNGGAAAAAIAMAVAFALFTAVFFVLAHRLEKDEEGQVRTLLSLRRQSWTFLFGGLLMMYITATCIVAWDYRDRMPDYTQQMWWPVAGYLFGMACGSFWRVFDNGRYLDLGLPSMLKSPTKYWVDYVQMPMGAALIMTWCVPVIVAWGPYSGILLALLGVLVCLMIVDGLRKLNPLDQHIKWNPKTFRPA